MHATVLAGNWEWKQRDSAVDLPRDFAAPGWTSATVPSNIHLELLKVGKIPDPFKGTKELDVQWVGETDWLYRTKFTAPEVATGSEAVLALDGLDTYATVFLNGVEIVKTDNMFVPYRVRVNSQLKAGENELTILFESAYLKGKEIEEQRGVLGCWNGDASRLYVRKAQYHYGWDWGPVLLTAGPWRQVRLEIYQARIEDLAVHVDVNEALKASLSVDAAIEHPADGQSVKVEVAAPNGDVVHSATVTLSGGHGLDSFSMENPQLWWPFGYGEHPLYTVTVTLLDKEGKTLDTQQKKIGLRRLRLIEEPLTSAPGTAFYFEVNNVPIFCGGSNWIPADSFTPRITAEKYRAWLDLMVEGNQRMIRVWGGGIYEEDCFYDLCDELGLLVWQDFMFACGKYPAYPEFQASVKKEAEANVRRIRHHPSLAIFTGNNEDYQYAESDKLEWDPNDKDGDWEKTTFPARAIYERLLPSVVKQLSPLTPYKPGSPYSVPTTDQTVGDLHQWNVWHQSQFPYQDYHRLGGRFVSEFGMQGFPDIRTVDSWLESPADRYPQSRVCDHHNKADGFERRIALYMVENFRYTMEMEDYVYGTQLMQAEALSSAYRAWRREWRGEGRRECGGALVWQINDCWPVTSWAIVDYNLRPKAAYYAIKRDLRPITVGVDRVKTVTPKDKRTRVFVDETTTVEVWGNNEALKAVDVQVRVQAFELVSGKLLKESFETKTLGANASTELYSFALPVGDQVVVSAQIIQDGVVLSRYVNWPEPFKYLTFPSQADAAVKVDVKGDEVHLSAARPVKGVAISVDGPGAEVRFDDNMIDLIPGDVQIIKAPGLHGRKVAARWLGDRE
ncbi:hypothetical protein HDV00_009020 [Rhizophlyctis rosea]|nr:hypothetical protein HDV00_009020 [Rhizophlyctis rosea]